MLIETRFYISRVFLENKSMSYQIAMSGTLNILFIKNFESVIICDEFKNYM